jgi:uncharacterized protein YkwD
LAALAAFAADALPPGASALSPELVEFVSQHLGLYDVAPELVVIDVPRNDAAGAVSRALAPRLEGHAYTHYGAVLVARGADSLLVVALAERGLQLEPVPRQSPLGQPIRLRGRLPDGLRNPRVDFTVEGAPRQVLAAGAGPDFDVQIATPRVGPYPIEVLGDGDAGSVVLARLTVYVDRKPPVTFAQASASPAVDLVAVRAQLLAAINAERARAGVPALQEDALLDLIALRHSVDMRDHAFMSHESALTGGPADRVEHAGLGRGLVLENIVRGSDASTLHQSALAQAGLRSNLLHREVTHVGLGVVPVRGAGGSLLLTELFVQQTRPIDVSSAAPTLLSMLNETRKTRGAPALALDAQLATVAEEAARQFVDTPGASEQSVIDAANAKLQRLSVSYRRVAAVLVIARALDDARALEPALEPSVSHAGIGVAQGTRADRGGRVLVIVLVLAWPR